MACQSIDFHFNMHFILMLHASIQTVLRSQKQQRDHIELLLPGNKIKRISLKWTEAQAKKKKTLGHIKKKEQKTTRQKKHCNYF